MANTLVFMFQEPRAVFSKVRHHIPPQLEYLNQGFTTMFNGLADILDPADMQNLRTYQRIVDAAFGRVRDAYGQY